MNNIKPLLLQNSMFKISLWNSLASFSPLLSFSFNSNRRSDWFCTLIINPFLLGHKNTEQYHLWMVKTAKIKNAILLAMDGAHRGQINQKVLQPLLHNVFCRGLINVNILRECSVLISATSTLGELLGAVLFYLVFFYEENFLMEMQILTLSSAN